MKLRELIKDINQLKLFGSQNPEILGLSLDSRQVGEGFLFAAIPGTNTDGHRFIPSAIKSGASAILCSKLPDKQDSVVPYLLVEDVSKALGEVCSRFYGNPEKDLNVVGVTGTNGKTSIVSWLFELGGKLGYPCGLISTIRIMVRDESYPASHTTPDVISLYSYLQHMVRAGCQYVFIEVSSHALDQKRVEGLKFTGAVFTNLTRDHLDYHPDFQAYLNAKKSLFDKLDKGAFALVNHDDKHSDIMMQNSEARSTKYSIRTIVDYYAKLIEQISQAMLIQLNGKELWVPFIGKFNVSNLTAVYGVSRELGWNEEEVLTGISGLGQVDGRFERIDLGDQVTGIVDYAHTPAALENVLEAIREMCKSEQRIITVIGAGGDRDKGKRPKMAQAACKSSDIVILTSDNPRSEGPERIIEDMKEGIPVEMESQVFSLTNRREAIRLAVALSQEGDYVLVAGKGHENYQEINGVRHHFDDREELIGIK